MYLIFRLDDPEYLDILGKYFDIKGYEEDDEMLMEIQEDPEVSSGFYFYSSKESGRILVMTHTGGDCDGLLLFSPLGILETWSANYEYDAEALGMITKKVLDKNIRFRNKLIGNLCEAKRRFNSSFRIFFDVDFDFFLECEAIAEINPFCMDRNEFKDLSQRISLTLNSFNKTKVENVLENEIKGSIDALRKMFQKAGKIHNVTDELKDLSTIHNVRNTVPIHSTDKYFADFLKKFNKKYPNTPENWSDLSIFVLQKTFKIIDKISNVLAQ